MSGDDSTTKDGLLPALELGLDQACDRFEAAWIAGGRPVIEEFVNVAPASERSALMKELVLLDVYYRRRAGEQPRSAEYQDRFPALAPTWLEGALSVPTLANAAGSELPAVPGYEVQSELGRGGMGVVYRARQSGLQRLVALKMILAGPDAGPQDVARFRSEAEAVARLHHPNIVQIYEVGDFHGRPYIALEYVDGGSLARRLHGVPQPAQEAARLVETLARAVHHAHERRIIHRDLKPANILLGVEGGEWRVEGEERQSTTLDPPPPTLDSPPSTLHPPLSTLHPKITDFGLAKRLDVAAGQTQPGALLGTPNYMAPEQATAAADALGPATDVHALGAILYELLTGRPPFQGATLLDTLEQVRCQEPVPPTRLQPRLPRDLETVCLKCLQKDWRKRYPSAQSLADDLGRFLAGEPIRARPVAVWERALKWARRRPATAALVTVSALAVLTVTLGSLWYNAQLTKAVNQAEANAAQARLEEEAKERERLRATASADKARTAIDRMLRRVATTHLANAPHMDQQRRQLLEDALELLQELLKDRDNSDPQVRRDTAAAFDEAGLIYGLLGRREQSEAAYRQAVTLAEQLTVDFPDTDSYRWQVASSGHNWAQALWELGQTAAAEAACRKALDHHRQLVRAQPDNVIGLNNLGNNLNTLGEMCRWTGARESAVRAYQESLEVWKALPRDHPKAAAFRNQEAFTGTNLASAYLTAGKTGLAEREFQEACTLLEGLNRDHPTSTE
jgi:serine/threonine protein kinase